MLLIVLVSFTFEFDAVIKDDKVGLKVTYNVSSCIRKKIYDVADSRLKITLEYKNYMIPVNKSQLVKGNVFYEFITRSEFSEIKERMTRIETSMFNHEQHDRLETPIFVQCLYII